jgi:hypothetical protein
MKKMKKIMLVEKNIKIKTNPSNYHHYLERGYIIKKCGDYIDIDINDLPKSSHVKVKCLCDNCKIEKVIKYSSYIIYTKLHNIYTCYKCCGVKQKKTSKLKYNCDNFQSSDEFNLKWEESIVEKYGSKENYSKFIKDISREKCREKYGVENVFQLKNVKEKIKNTMIDKYGVEHALQHNLFFDKSQKTGKKVNYYNGIVYQGTFELDFLKFCEDNCILVERAKTIMYLFDKKERRYYPDFYLPKYNIICEIKSSYYYFKELNKNIQKNISTIENGFNHLFIIDKNYDKLKFLIKKI